MQTWRLKQNLTYENFKNRFLTDEEKLDLIDLNVIEKYLRNKKLKNINNELR